MGKTFHLKDSISTFISVMIKEFYKWSLVDLFFPQAQCVATGWVCISEAAKICDPIVCTTTISDVIAIVCHL